MSEVVWPFLIVLAFSGYWIRRLMLIQNEDRTQIRQLRGDLDALKRMNLTILVEKHFPDKAVSYRSKDKLS